MEPVAPIPEKPLVLNVDNDEACRYAVTRLLERNNFAVKEAACGADALRLAVSERPDVILLDINLPDSAGFDVCCKLKSNPVTARIPVLHRAASLAQTPDIAQGRNPGAETLLTEQVESEVLVAAINSVLSARRAEQEAQKLAREWQATFEAIRDGVAVTDLDGRVLRANEEFASLIGRPASQVAGSRLSDFWPNLTPEQAPFTRMPGSQRRESIELELGAKVLSLRADPVLNEAGEPSGAVWLATDVTESRRVEDEFREGQKLETIGTLAAGVAHDFNNLLTSIMGNASLALGGDADPAVSQQRLEEIVHAGQRAADLTKQLLAYAGKARPQVQAICLSELVQQTEKLIEAAIPKKVALEFRTAVRLPAVLADANQIRQLLLNLVANSVEAIGDAPGTILIQTGPAAPAGVYLEVRDDGCGMDSETRARMFDPFFTTKFTGRGLGLAAVAGIARTHGARIEVHSAPAKGSSVQVIFPAVALPQPVAPQAASTGRAGRVTVLVVDDEEIVRRVAVAALEMRGYAVLTAPDGREAIRFAREHPEIGVVLLDLTMPVMGGEEAIGEILLALPQAKVIVSTGYDSATASARFKAEQVAAFMQKPYTARQLIEKITVALKAGN